MEPITEKGLRVPIKTWLPRGEIEPAAMQQLRNAARHPAVTGQIAVMPDCHPGLGVTIGCVFPTANAIIPVAVGSDIGCGMAAVDTGIRLDPAVHDGAFWHAWAERVRALVPVGFGTHSNRVVWQGLDRPLRAKEIVRDVARTSSRSLGTLGGGNHFLEAQVDEAGRIWLMVHSGSRQAGGIISDHYTSLARAITEKRGQVVPRYLWSLPMDDESGQNYLHDLGWASTFAFESRQRMLERMLDALDVSPNEISPAAFINVHHNVAQVEEHFGERVVVHRKGATSARLGELAIIPGSIGASSFIVRGKGNPESLMSCSHGAGRRLSRSDAKQEIDADDLEIALLLAETYTPPSRSLVDEAPQAYKDINHVIALQADLIDVVHTLRPLMTIKGDARARDD